MIDCKENQSFLKLLTMLCIVALLLTFLSCSHASASDGLVENPKSETNGTPLFMCDDSAYYIIGSKTAQSDITILDDRKNVVITKGINDDVIFRGFFVLKEGSKYRLHLSSDLGVDCFKIYTNVLSLTNLINYSIESYSGKLWEGDNTVEFVAGDINAFEISIPPNIDSLCMSNCYLELLIGEEKIYSQYYVTNKSIYTSEACGETEIYYDGFINTTQSINDFIIGNRTGNDKDFILKNDLYRIRISQTASTGIKYLYIADKYGAQNVFGLQIYHSLIPENPTNRKNILMLGDSLTYNKMLPVEFYNYLQTTGLTNYIMIGRVQDEIVHNEAVRYEASGGYSWNNYVDNPSQLPEKYANNYFWNPLSDQLDMQYYFDRYCNGETPDYIICNVGINHFVNSAYSSKIDDIAFLCRSFLNCVHNTFPKCKVILCGSHHGCPDNLIHNNVEYKDFTINLG